MLDPFPIPPPVWLVRSVKPAADALSLHSLPLHAHEVIFALLLYNFVASVISPRISTFLFPKSYPRLSPRTRLNWDVHVVSLVQSLLINSLSLWVILSDDERRSWRGSEQWQLRIWGYHGAGGLCQSFALGYFLWDMYMCSRYVSIFGWGMLAHAISAVSVFALGYRPFLYYSAPVFLLYELSSPFLNVHWFCDKLDLTGSVYQAVNGAFLTSTFFCCRLVWGTYSSVLVFRDIFGAIAAGHTQRSPASLAPPSTERLMAIYADPSLQPTAFNPDRSLPLWLALVYLASNLTLNTLNIFWFGKMVQTIRARFDPPLGTRRVEAPKDPAAGHVGSGLSEKTPKGSVREARLRAEEALDRPIEDVADQRAVFADTHAGADVTGSSRPAARSRRKA